MTTAIKRRRGTTSQHSTFTGLEGEITVDTTKETLVVHDGATAGGHPLAKENNPTFTGNATFSGGTANGVAYLNGSKVLTTGSALTFDGSRLDVGGIIANGSAIYWGGGVGKLQFGGSDAYIDSTGSMIFRHSGSTEGMRLTSTGLGIGTSSPGTKLEVAGGGIAIANAQQLQWRTSGGSLAAILKLNASNNVEFGDSQTSSSAMVLASGNLGLGVTPSAWAGYTALQVKGGTALASSGVETELATNCYFNSGWKYSNASSLGASLYESYNGTHAWYTAPSGTAGNAISFTQAMTLDASGSLVVGGTTVVTNNGGITATTTSSGSVAATLAMRNAGTANGSGTTLAFRGVTNAGSEADYAYLSMVADDTTAKTGSIRFSTVAGSSPVERARIDSSGNFIQSAPSTAPSLATNGQMVFNLTSNTNLRVSVRGSDGVTRTANITLA